MIALESNGYYANETNGYHKHDDKEDDIYNRDRYIVMELLKPSVTQNYLISAKNQQKNSQNGKNDLLEKSYITNELGIYGVLVK
jgi:hypothetical protein